MLISVFDLWILIDRCNLCVQTVHCGGTSRYNTCKNHSNTGSPCAITFKRKPTTMSWSRYCFKKHHISYVLQINTNIKFTIKYTPFSTQHILIHVTWWERVQLDTLRKQMETNITTRNCCPSWTSRLSIMNIAAVHHEHRGCPSWTSRLQRWQYKPTGAIRRLYPSGLSANYNRCPWWTHGNGVIHPVCSVLYGPYRVEESQDRYNDWPTKSPDIIAINRMI